MADAASIKANIRAEFRDFAIDGVPASGAYEPQKPGIRSALTATVDLAQEAKDIASQAGTTFAVATVADLADLTPTAVGDRAEVRDDPAGDVEDGNGVYSWTGSTWVWISGLIPASVTAELQAAQEAALTRERPLNLFANGALDENGPTPLFRQLLTTQRDYSGDVVGITDAVLAQYGLGRALVVSPSTVAAGGDRLTQSVRLQGGRIRFAVLVKTLTGGWDFGANAVWNGPSAWIRYTDNLAPTSAKLTSFETVGANVRLYQGEIPLTAGKTASRIELGLVPVGAHADGFALSGFWASHSLNDTLALADTAWPNWSASASAFPATLAARVAAVETKTTLQRARDLLGDRMRSARIVLVGDSQTWGLKASGASADSPRNHALADPRNTVDAAVSPSWANLLIRWLCDTFNRASITTGTPGQAGASVETEFNPAVDPAFAVIHRPTGGRQNKTTGTNAAARLSTYLDLNQTIDQALTFSYTGGDLSIVRARLGGTGTQYVVEVDGVVAATINYGGVTVAFGEIDAVPVAYGPHDVRIYPLNTSSNILRIEAIRFERTLTVQNQGIIGTNSGEWLPGGTLFDDGIAAEDDIVLIDLGTNDRSTYSSPVRLEMNLRTIVAQLKADGKIVVLQTPCKAVSDLPAITLTNFDLSQAAAVVRKIGAEMGVSVIDNYAAFATNPTLADFHPVDDSLHFNDAGQAFRFRNMVLALSGSQAVG